jgi:pseudomonalisin
MFNRAVLRATLLFALAAAVPSPALARAHRVIDDNDTVSLRGNVHPLARHEFDRGASEPSLPMDRMILSLSRSPGQQAELDRLLAEQQDPASSSYHRWLTPEQFGERFGPPPEDVAAITGWLTSHGFTVEGASQGRSSITFSGTAAKVERAFHAPMHDYLVDGKLHHANAQDPAVPRGLADLVAGVVSLNDFPYKPMNSGARPVGQSAAEPNYTSGSAHYLSPGDFATIYNLNPLYAAGVDGTGQAIAIVGRTHPSSSNWTTFRSSMGLPANPVQVIVNGPDPGDLDPDEAGEADLDVEWSGAVAKNATIIFVVSQSGATDGVALSAQYIVDHNVAPVMSTSFGLCESTMSAAGNAFYNSLWQQAAAIGITSFSSSGDSCPAVCAPAGGSVPGVNGLASTPYNVAVGGTQFADGAGGYWSPVTGSYYTSALGYIPETTWNESGNEGGSGLWSSGGGVSLNYTRPDWQVAPGVPAGNKRYLPDVSLSAAGHDAYLVRTRGVLSAFGGTSASSPAFAGLMALIVQKTGQRQGNANIRLYQLASAQYGSGGAAVFHDTTTGNNSVPGVAGFSAAAGYDLATGLGSVDAAALVNNWAIPPAPLTISSAGALANGSVGVTYSATLDVSGGLPPYSWSLTGGELEPGLTLAPASGVVSGTPTTPRVASFTLQVIDSLGSSAAKNFTQAVSAAACANWPVRLAGSSHVLYPGFPSAYLLAAESDLIQLQALDFSADFVLDRDLRVSLSGGYDCGYTANAAATGLLGRLRVTSGTVQIDKLRFR